MAKNFFFFAVKSVVEKRKKREIIGSCSSVFSFVQSDFFGSIEIDGCFGFLLLMNTVWVKIYAILWKLDHNFCCFYWKIESCKFVCYVFLFWWFEWILIDNNGWIFSVFRWWYFVMVNNSGSLKLVLLGCYSSNEIVVATMVAAYVSNLFRWSKAYMHALQVG